MLITQYARMTQCTTVLWGLPGCAISSMIFVFYPPPPASVRDPACIRYPASIRRNTVFLLLSSKLLSFCSNSSIFNTVSASFFVVLHLIFQISLFHLLEMPFSIMFDNSYLITNMVLYRGGHARPSYWKFWTSGQKYLIINGEAVEVVYLHLAKAF